MFRKFFIKIFALIFLLTISTPTSMTKAANSYTNKSYTLPIKLVDIHSDSPSANFSLIKTAVIKETAKGTFITLSLETKQDNYILDIRYQDKNHEKNVTSFYRIFNEKTKTYIHQIQFEFPSKEENLIKLGLITSDSKPEQFDIDIELDWEKAKELNTKKFQETSTIKKPLVNNSVDTIKNPQTETRSIMQKQSLADASFKSPVSNPSRMQEYINYYNKVETRLANPTASKSVMQKDSARKDEAAEDVLNEDFKEEEKKEEKRELRSLSDFFANDTRTKDDGFYVIDISASHLNPLNGKLADENSKDSDTILKLAQAIISPNPESENSLKEALRQDTDSSNKKWARAGLERRDGKLFARVRLHLTEHITRSVDEGPFFKVLQENGDYKLVTAEQIHLNINKGEDSYADYVFEVPRENFSAMIQVNIESMNKNINFFIESNPRSIKKGNLAGTETEVKPASPLTKTIVLAIVLLLITVLPLLIIRRKRQLDEEYEYEEYDEEEYED